jgi:uncharacterized membrane protein HdeD (DUF308 family)
MPAVIALDPEALRKHSTWFTIYGVVLALLGAAAIIMPGIATLATTILLGWLLLASGVIALIAVFSAGTSVPGFWWNLLTAIIYLLAGASLLWSPIAGIITLTIFLAAYFLATGVTKLIAAIGYRQAIPGAWGWVLFSAIVDIALSVLIFTGLPGSAIWVLGLMVGINLLMGGIALIVAANCTRKMSASAAA